LQNVAIVDIQQRVARIWLSLSIDQPAKRTYFIAVVMVGIKKFNK
jgi:hypothetical protein